MTDYSSLSVQKLSKASARSRSKAMGIPSARQFYDLLGPRFLCPGFFVPAFFVDFL